MITAVQWGDHNSVITAVYDGVIKKVITVGWTQPSAHGCERGNDHMW